MRITRCDLVIKYTELFEDDDCLVRTIGIHLRRASTVWPGRRYRQAPVLYLRKGTKFSPYLIGGHQERGRRGGTEATPSIIGAGGRR